MNLPEEITRYLNNWFSKQHTIGYLLLDNDGAIQAWGGHIEYLGIEPLMQGGCVSDHLIFMEGMLPAADSPVHLPMVKLKSGHIMDVHLFCIDTGYGLVLIDAEQKARQTTEFQQQANDMALIKETQATTYHQIYDDLFYACNMAALKLDDMGRFVLIGRAPDWLTHFFPDIATQPCQLLPENEFSFLENFLHEAHMFWRTQRVGSIKSGMWIEADDAGQEHLFEATAINTGTTNILLIADEHSTLSEKKSLIQKGRELALGQDAMEKSQSQLQVAHDELEGRIRQHTHELEQTNLRLASELSQRQQLEKERTEILLQLQQAQKMEAIGTLAGGIAHDFNNILSAVIGFTELSLFEAHEGSQLKSNLQHVFEAAQRAKELIRQILTFSRQSNPETQPVQVVLIINEALKLLRASLPASIEIEQELHSQAFIMADPTQLHQVVMNLCTNASHAMQADGGILKIRLEDHQVREEDVSDYPNLLPGDYIELSIIDNGHGMSNEVLTRIYDPFFTTKPQGHGTGMGLPVVHGIVRSCKGDVFVTSRPGKGTTFRVMLPTVQPSDTLEIAMPDNFPRGTEHILFVDDEPMQTDLAMQILAELGYRVDTFTDSAAALHEFTLTPDKFDLVITDMFMPKMTGKTLAARIHQIRPQTPIILCSGYGNGRPNEPTEKDHIKGYLMKPFGMMEMAQTIRKVLDE